MPAYRLTNKAIEDLRSIARYTEQTWGREQRNKYLSKFDASFQMLVHEPELGRACDEIRQGYRKHHVGRHLIFYRLIASRIEIIRILHDSMDIDSYI
jgi:toxin ParE1/3/4